MGTFCVIHLMRFPAIRARRLGHCIALVFRRLHCIEFQFLALLAAINIYGKCTGQQIPPGAGDPAKLPQLNLFLAHMGHFPATAEAGFPIHSLSPFAKNAPCPCGQRASTYAVPPLVRRSLAKAASWSAITPRRNNGRTRRSPTWFPVQAAAPGCISYPVPSPSHQTGGSLGGTRDGTSPCHRSSILMRIISALVPFVKRKTVTQQNLVFVEFLICLSTVQQLTGSMQGGVGDMLSRSEPRQLLHSALTAEPLHLGVGAAIPLPFLN